MSHSQQPISADFRDKARRSDTFLSSDSARFRSVISRATQVTVLALIEEITAENHKTSSPTFRE